MNQREFERTREVALRIFTTQGNDSKVTDEHSAETAWKKAEAFEKVASQFDPGEENPQATRRTKTTA